MRTGTLILAAGAGARLGGAARKAFVPIAGRPMVAYSLISVEAAAIADRTVLVVAEADLDRARALLDESQDLQVDDVVVGGKTRQDSVRLGLAALPEQIELVLCHDAARPFASPALFRRVAETARSLAATGGGGAIPVIPSPDTVKRYSRGRVLETIPREAVGLVQTPQAFDAATLRRAHEAALRNGLEATDDAMLLEAMGSPVVVVEGETSNFKITTREDLVRAEAFVAGREERVRG